MITAAANTYTPLFSALPPRHSCRQDSHLTHCPLRNYYRVCLSAVTRCQPLTASTVQRQGYTADNPTATTVGGLGAIGCFAETHVPLPDRAPTVGCPQANGTFILEGCVQRASCSTLSCSVGNKPLATQTDADAPLLCASSVRKWVFGAIWIKTVFCQGRLWTNVEKEAISQECVEAIDRATCCTANSCRLTEEQLAAAHGYRFVSSSSPSTVAGLGRVTCRGGFGGEGIASSARVDCLVDGEPFQLSGCEPNVCTAMTTAGLRELGYTAAHPDAVTAGGLGAIDCFAATHVLEQANTAPSASCREAHGIFALSGCALRAACSSTADTDIQCAEGLQYNASAATDLCSGAVCDISTADGVDTEICCEVDPCFGCSCSVERAPSPPPPPSPSVMPVIVCDDPAMVHSDVGQCECAVSYYNTSSQILHCFEDDIEPAVNAARRSCELCPPCATCAGGQGLPLLKDDWVEPEKSTSSVALPQQDDLPRHRLAFQCDPQRGCSGAHRDSAGCDEGHTGAMCQSCEEQYFLDASYDCVSCEARQSSRTIVLAILLLIVLALAFAAISYRRKVERGWDIVPGAQEDEDTQLSAPLQTMQWFGRTLCVRLVL
eukprot:COSAG06_NODE_5079_length_3736_cov_3.059033_6_plen_604_part_01